jgi:hypothetical protein
VLRQRNHRATPDIVNGPTGKIWNFHVIGHVHSSATTATTTETTTATTTTTCSGPVRLSRSESGSEGERQDKQSILS